MKAKNTAEIGSIEAKRLDLTGPTILAPLRKAVYAKTVPMRIIPANAKKISKDIGILAPIIPVNGTATNPEMVIPTPITRMLPHF